MKRLKLKHAYHDSFLRSVEVTGRRLVLSVELAPGVTRHLFFAGVRNLDELRELFGLPTDASSIEVDAEIVGIVREDDGRILVDLMNYGSVRVDCKNLSET